MSTQRTLVSAVMAAMLLVAAAGQVVAQNVSSTPSSGSHPVPKGSQLINVSHCSAALNVMQSGGYAGYTPGYWGPRGYWGDVYGGSFYSPPITTTNPQMAVDYMNITHKTMTEIEFGLVANGVLKAEARDVGTFSPNAEIKHKYGIPASTFPLGTGLPRCVPLRITFQDGTHWRNPALPPKNEHIYYHP